MFVCHGNTFQILIYFELSKDVEFKDVKDIMGNVPRRIYHIDFISVSGEVEIITDQLDKMNINEECLDMDTL